MNTLMNIMPVMLAMDPKGFAGLGAGIAIGLGALGAGIGMGIAAGKAVEA